MMVENHNCILEPEGFLEVIHAHTDRFPAGEQQDAQEFLVYLLDVIHEDLNRVKVEPKAREAKEKTESRNLSTLALEESAKVSWKNYLIDNKSIVVDIFQGQIKSLLRCIDCNSSSSTFDPVMYFSLPFPENMEADKKIGIHELFREYTKTERLESRMHCKNCERKTLYDKKIDIWKAPNILIVHFKRFKFTKGAGGAHTSSKICNEVEYPVKNFDISEFVNGFQRIKPIYNLFAVCVPSTPLTLAARWRPRGGSLPLPGLPPGHQTMAATR
jgi:ubiquitin carboxyl-terminal hydrolase 8